MAINTKNDVQTNQKGMPIKTIRYHSSFTRMNVMKFD